MKPQCVKLLRYLQEHGPATKVEVRRDTGIDNVGGRISDLRKAGIPIEREMIDVETREDVATVARYSVTGITLPECLESV